MGCRGKGKGEERGCVRRRRGVVRGHEGSTGGNTVALEKHWTRTRYYCTGENGVEFGRCKPAADKPLEYYGMTGYHSGAYFWVMMVRLIIL